MNQQSESSLVEDEAPLILPDGSEILPAERAPVQTNFVEVPSGTEAISIVVATRRSIVDMPVPPKQMNAISVVVAYKMFGLNDADISVATGIPLERVERMQMLDAFTEMWDAAVSNIIAADSADIEQMIHRTARNAVNRLSHVNNESTDPFAIIASSKDLLDRHERTKERKGKDDNNALRIEIIRRDESETNPEMEFNDGDSS